MDRAALLTVAAIPAAVRSGRLLRSLCFTQLLNYSSGLTSGAQGENSLIRPLLCWTKAVTDFARWAGSLLTIRKTFLLDERMRPLRKETKSRAVMAPL
jgi:hypothetical protein